MRSDRAPLYFSSRSAIQTMDISHVTNYSSSMSRQPLYDVFLSFRGLDTPNDFADCLHTSLIDAGFVVFMAEEELESGEEIIPQQIQAIKQSKISIPVISKDYGSSKSRLMELEQMLKCRDSERHIIIPIFYFVDPSDIRHCTGPFESSLCGHKRKIDGSIIDSWKSALGRIGQVTGHHIHKTSEVPHHKLIKQIVYHLLRKLKKEHLIVPKHLVGVDPHVRDIMAKLKVDYRNGQAVNIAPTREIISIHGIPGVGKTALAKHVYNKLYHLFDACSFLEKIAEEISHVGQLSVQNRLISHLHKGNAQKFTNSDYALKYIEERFRTMKILILLDDIEDYEQLNYIFGKFDWLGPGSRVILTSRRQDVIRNIKGAESFVLGLMEQDDALQLFCRHAFLSDSPQKTFETLSINIVAATGRLPLALEVVGSSLFLVKEERVWKETLDALQAGPAEGVQAALMTSYMRLDVCEKKIFLDIACCFAGQDMRIPRYMWSDCYNHPYMSILVLRENSLVEIGEDKELCMHGILKDFGRQIVKNENKNQPCKRSRLWDPKEAVDVLKGRKGTPNVEVLTLEFGDSSEGNITFECDQFDGLQNLRFLKLDRAGIQGHFGDRLRSLRWLDWQGCPKILDVQSLNLNLHNLVILDLSWSQVFTDWSRWKLLAQARKLKVLRLTGCVQLIATPNFPASMELERLILDGCSRLAVIGLSFGNLKKLVSLNMKKCSLLHELPDLGPTRDLKELVIDGTSISRINFKEGSVRQLKILSARNCKKLNEIPDSIKYLQYLKYLALDGTDIHSLRESIGSLENLQTLSLKNCRSLTHLPDGIGKLPSLQFLDLSDTVIQKLPPSVKDLKAMKVLRMRGTFIREFPEAILNLEKLEEIDFSSCLSLRGEIHCDIWRLSSLVILKLSRTQISGLPASFYRLSHLQELDVFGCDNLQSLPKLPSSLINVRGNLNQ